MFENEFADRAYDLYNEKTVKVRGMNGLHKFDSRFDYTATARVIKIWYGPFGGTQYKIYCRGEDGDGEYQSYSHIINTADDLAEIAEMISVKEGVTC